MFSFWFHLICFSIGINMHFIDTLFNCYHIWFNPLSVLCLNKKGEKNLLFWFCFYPFVDDWQKGGEEFEFYMHICVFAYSLHLMYRSLVYMHIYACVMFHFNWYQEHVNMWFKIGIKSMFICVSRTFTAYTYCLFVMHELRGSFFEA